MRLKWGTADEPVPDDIVPLSVMIGPLHDTEGSLAGVGVARDVLIGTDMDAKCQAIQRAFSYLLELMEHEEWIGQGDFSVLVLPQKEWTDEEAQEHMAAYLQQEEE